MDGGDPRRAGIGRHHSRGAEDRQPALDAEAAVHRFLRQRRAVLDADLDRCVAAAPQRPGGRGHRGADHRARRRVDRRLPHRERETGAGHRPDPLSGAERNAAPRRPGAHRRKDQRAVGHVGVVARVLDHSRGRPAVAQRLAGEREGGSPPARKRHRHRVGKPPGEQRFVSGARGRRGAGACGPAAAKLSLSRHGSHISAVFRVPPARRRV